jgi:hypothetical protein
MLESLNVSASVCFAANAQSRRGSAVKGLMVYGEVLIEQVLKVVEIEWFGYKGIRYIAIRGGYVFNGRGENDWWRPTTSTRGIFPYRTDKC